VGDAGHGPLNVLGVHDLIHGFAPRKKTSRPKGRGGIHASSTRPFLASLS
jgi:hypothetical protein